MPHLLSLSSRATEVPQERPAQWEAPASPQPPPATTREKATEQWRLSIAKNKQMNKIIFKNFQVILKRSWDEQPPTKRSPRFLFQSHMTTMWLSSSEWLRDQDWKQNKAEHDIGELYVLVQEKIRELAGTMELSISCPKTTQGFVSLRSRYSAQAIFSLKWLIIKWN